jgi:hypothetical protein
MLALSDLDTLPLADWEPIRPMADDESVSDLCRAGFHSWRREVIDTGCEGTTIHQSCSCGMVQEVYLPPLSRREVA